MRTGLTNKKWKNVCALVILLTVIYATRDKTTKEHPSKESSLSDFATNPFHVKELSKAITEPYGKEMERRNSLLRKEALSATKNRRPMKHVLADDSLDMPPQEHPHKWGRISSEHGTCWYHNDTMRKVCE